VEEERVCPEGYWPWQGECVEIDECVLSRWISNVCLMLRHHHHHLPFPWWHHHHHHHHHTTTPPPTDNPNGDPNDPTDDPDGDPNDTTTLPPSDNHNEGPHDPITTTTPKSDNDPDWHVVADERLMVDSFFDVFFDVEVNTQRHCHDLDPSGCNVQPSTLNPQS
jgi:hypothetical protein